MASGSKKSRSSDKTFRLPGQDCLGKERLTQAKFAKPRPHVSYLSGLETGQRTPRLIALSQSAQALGLKLSKLVERAEQQ